MNSPLQREDMTTTPSSRVELKSGGGDGCLSWKSIQFLPQFTFFFYTLALKSTPGKVLQSRCVYAGYLHSSTHRFRILITVHVFNVSCLPTPHTRI